MPWSWAGFANPDAAAADYFSTAREKRQQKLQLEMLDKEHELNQKYADQERQRADKEEMDALTTTAIEHPRQIAGGDSIPLLREGSSIDLPAVNEPAYTTAKFQQAARKSLPAISASGNVAQESGAYPLRKGLGAATGKADTAGASYREKLAMSGLAELPSRTAANIAQNNAVVGTSPFTTARDISAAKAGAVNATLRGKTDENLLGRGFDEAEGRRLTAQSLEAGDTSIANMRNNVPDSSAAAQTAQNNLRRAKAIEGGYDIRSEAEVKADSALARKLDNALRTAAISKQEKDAAINALETGLLNKAIVKGKNGGLTIDYSKLSQEESDIVQTALGLMKSTGMQGIFEAEYMRRRLGQERNNSWGPAPSVEQPTTAKPKSNLGQDQ